MYRGKLSIRRVSVLVRHLLKTSGSALFREINGDAADWSVTDYLLAHVIDNTQVANYLFQVANSEKDADIPEPKPFPRPGEHSAEPEKNFASPQEVANLFTQLS